MSLILPSRLIAQACLDPQTNGMLKRRMQLDHIQLAMPPNSEAEARAFWGDLLGMQEEPKPAPLDQRGGCWFRHGSTIVHVGVEANFQPQKKAHPGFVVADVNTLAERLASAGRSIQWDDALPDRRRFYCDDPFGNRLEFIASGDGFLDR